MNNPKGVYINRDAKEKGIIGAFYLKYKLSDFLES